MSEGTGGGGGQSSTGRLESWKEIAAYLRRSVRTVQDWEKNESLPVYRHVHNKLGTVYAFKSELDAWWHTRRATLDPKGGTANGPASWWLALPPRAVWLLATVTAVSISAVVWFTASHRAQPEQERRWLLAADFENRTGEPVLDGILKPALEREFAQPGGLRLVPHARVQEVLRLMKRPLDSRIDFKTAQEIHLRDGGTSGLITGAIEKLDGAYQLSLRLSGAEGQILADFGAQAKDHTQARDRAARLFRELRSAAAKQLPQTPGNHPKLERVTTSSLRALQYYSEARRLYDDFKRAPAVELLQRALGEDPDFASGHVLLAYCHDRLGRPAEARAAFQRAFDLSESTTDVERYFIAGSYYDYTRRDVGKAAQSYEVLLNSQPDHYWGINELARLYERTGQLERAVPYMARRADLRPQDFESNVVAALALSAWAKSRSRAEPYLGRARSLLSPGSSGSGWELWLDLLPGYEHWLRGEPVKMLQEVDRVAATFDPDPGDSQRAHIGYVFSAHVALGRLRSAEQIASALPPERRAPRLALIAFERGDKRAALQNLLKGPRSWRSRFLLAWAGRPDEAELGMDALHTSSFHATVSGEIARERHDLARAGPLLEKGIRTLRPSGYPAFFWASESLADIWEQQGQTAKAVEVLEEAIKERERAAYSGDVSPFAWVRAATRLARLYVRLGRWEDASRTTAELQRLLAVADADHPILAELHSLRQQIDARQVH